MYRCYTVSSMRASLRWPCSKNALSLPRAVTLDPPHSPISVVIKEDVSQASVMESEGMFHLSVQRIPSKGGVRRYGFTRASFNRQPNTDANKTIHTSQKQYSPKHKTLSCRELPHDPLRHVPCRIHYKVNGDTFVAALWEHTVTFMVQ